MSTAWQAAEALLSLAAAGSVGIGVAVRRPPHRIAWLLVGACLAAFAAGDLLVLATDPDPVVGPIDALYLAGYPFLVAGLHLMYREGDRTRDRAGLVDAAIVAITAGLAGWVFLVGPVIGTATAAERAVLLAYLVLDVAVLGVATRLVVAGPTRIVPSLLALGVGVLLVTDVMHLRTGVDGRADLSEPVHLGWVLAAVLLAAAALHPDVRQGVSADPVRREALSRVRLALLAAVVLIPPALMSLQVARADYDDLAVLVRAGADCAGVDLGAGAWGDGNVSVSH